MVNIYLPLMIIIYFFSPFIFFFLGDLGYEVYSWHLGDSLNIFNTYQYWLNHPDFEIKDTQLLYYLLWFGDLISVPTIFVVSSITLLLYLYLNRFSSLSLAALILTPVCSLTFYMVGKEWFAFVLSFLAFYLFANRSFFAMSLVCCLLWFVRDGYGAILTATVILLIFADFSKTDLRVILVAVFVGASSFWLFIDFFIDEASYHIFRGRGLHLNSPILNSLDPNSPFTYLVRLIGGFFSIPIRVNFYNNGINISGLYYFISSLTLATIVVRALWLLVDSTASEKQVAFFVVSNVLMASISTFIQPRYLFPMISLIPFLFDSKKTFFKYIFCVSFMFMALRVGYFIAGGEFVIYENDKIPWALFLEIAS
ncbi:hypothetical protein N9J12_05820 [Alphaproteobacteria bacterium]|nr:hypothetical protein [Alphaproteobacteria bacterium]